MELLLIFVVLAAIRLIILDSRISMLKEDKRFLMEENSWLKNNLKGMIFTVENLADNRKNNNGSVRCESRQRKNKNNRIFIFNDSEPKETQELRNLLKKNYINGVMLINFEVLSSKLSSKDDVWIEESSLIRKNLYNLPIIFYGGNETDFKDFLEHYGWKNRKDLEWVKYPFEVEELKKALKEIKGK